MKARTVLGENGSDTSTTLFCNPYSMEIIQKYRSLGVRSEYMDRFEFISNKNKEIVQLGNFVNVDNYKQFSLCCEEAAELVKNNEVYRLRETAFHKMAAIYNESQEALTETGCTLIQEGSALCRYPHKAATILPMLMAINDKFNKWHNEVRPVHHPPQSSGQEGSEEDDFDYEDDEIDSGSGKRARPDEDAVEISD